MKAKRSCSHADVECARCRRFRVIDNRAAALAAAETRRQERFARLNEGRWRYRENPNRERQAY